MWVGLDSVWAVLLRCMNGVDHMILLPLHDSGKRGSHLDPFSTETILCQLETWSMTRWFAEAS